MRRTSLTTETAHALGMVLRERRLNRGLSVRRLEALSGVRLATIRGLETGEIFAPQVDTLRTLAGTLDLSITDLFAVAGWLPAGELPAMRPYFRAKYQDLDDQAIADLEAYAEQLRKRGAGPHNREDESPEHTTR